MSDTKFYATHDDMKKALRWEVLDKFIPEVAKLGFKLDRENLNCDGINLFLVNAEGVTIRVCFDGRASDSHRWSRSFKHRDFYWKVDPRHGMPSNRPRKIKFDTKAELPILTDVLAAFTQAVENQKAMDSAASIEKQKNDALHDALVELGYILDPSQSMVYNNDRILQGEKFFVAPKGGATTIMFHDGIYRHDAYVYRSEEGHILVLTDKLSAPSKNAMSLVGYMANHARVR